MSSQNKHIICENFIRLGHKQINAALFSVKKKCIVLIKDFILMRNGFWTIKYK